MNNKPNKNNGFTLVELSSVLLLIALILGMSVSIASSRIEVEKLKSTQARMDFIMSAVEQYVENYNHLPCPANALMLVTASAYGEGQGTGTIGGDCTADGTGLIDTGASGVVIGAVPTKTLGISTTAGFDGWDNLITYAVDEDLTIETGAGGYADTGSKGDISIVNGDTTPSATIITTDAAVVLLSHGKNSWGAWPGKGVVRITIAGGDANEDENADGNDNVFVDIFRSSTFDDTIIYRTKWQFGK